MRIVKEHDERKNEILNKAEKLFSVRGYEKCTINDILGEVGIAKGTFYYYFKSKEEVLNAIIERVTETVVERASAIVNDSGLSPEDKLLRAFLSLRVESEMEPGFMEELHRPENALMHQKSLESMMKGMTPILAKVVEEGNEKGSFHAEFPQQYMQIFLTAVSLLLDDGISQNDSESRQMLFRALIAVLAKMLGIPDEPMRDAVIKYWQ